MPNRPHVCVFCGSLSGQRAAHLSAARRLGESLARAGLGLVYGGGRVGMMGALADAALAAGGRVVGIIPKHLMQIEIAHQEVTELLVVPGMHERKAEMARRSAGFIMLSGGIGTFEEFFEMLTWAALGLHAKPIGVLNIDGYYDPLMQMLDHGVTEGFVRRRHLDLLLVSDDAEAIATQLLLHVPPPPGPLLLEADEV
jgi:uncharacterized protein (TIGR00730 family)